MGVKCEKITCEECMPNSPYDWCCRKECREHEFCRGCEYWSKRFTKGFTKEFPYKIGTFVILKDALLFNKLRIGTVESYSCVTDDDKFIINVSGYKDNWYRSYSPDRIEVATDEQVKIYKSQMGIS